MTSTPPQPVGSPPPRRPLVPWVVLALSLLATAWAAWLAGEAADARERARFDRVADRQLSLIRARLDDFAELLEAGRGLFAASQSVEAEEWRAFAEALHPERRYPGIAAMGYIARVQAADREVFLEDRRRQGKPDFRIEPAGGREEYFVVSYIGAASSRRLGDDLRTLPDRRDALERARDTGALAMTSPVDLIGQDRRTPAVVLYAPVFANGAPQETQDQRRAAIAGWVSAPVRIGEAFHAALGGEEALVCCRIYDGARASAESLLFASPGADSDGGPPSRWETTDHLVAFGRTWTLEFRSRRGVEGDAILDESAVVGAIGGVLSLLLFGIVWSVSSTRERALRLASRITATLREREAQHAKLALLASRTQSAVILADAEGRIEWVNEGFARLSGYSAGEAVGRRPEEFLEGPGASPGAADLFRARIAAGKPFRLEVAKRARDGRPYEVAIEGVPMRDGEGVSGFMTIETDVTEQRRAERELSANLERYRLLFDLSPCGILVEDETGAIIDANPALYRSLGYEPETLLGRHVASIAHGDFTPKVADNIRRILAGETLSQSASSRRADGTSAHFLLNEGRISLPGGKLGIMTVSLDVSEQIQSEEALRASEQRLKAVLDAATQVSIIATDPAGVITVFNAGAERLLGYRADELIGQTTPSVFHLPEEVEARGRELEAEYGKPVKGFEVFVEPARRGGFDIREWTYVRKDGARRTVSLAVTALRIRGADVTGFLGVAVDVTERVRAEKTLAENLERYRRLFDLSPCGIIVEDSEGRVLEANPAFVATFGATREAIVGRRVHELAHPDVRPYVDSIRAPALAGEPVRVTVKVPHPDGAERHLDLNIGRIPLPGGAVGLISVTLDVSDAVRAREELLRAKEAAEAATMMKSEFLATMSHEIRTPMNGVIGMTGLLLDTQLGIEQREYAETVRTSATALLTIINDILDFSKIESGKLELESIPFSIHSVAEEVGDLLAHRAQQKSLEVAVVVSRDVPPMVQGDPGRLRQVLLNLVGNAIKFTDAGEVALRVEASAPREGRPGVRFEVADTGIGIPPGSIDRLFQAFSQVDSSTTRRFGGTGLGLAISRELVERMGGRIAVDSEPGRGSTFSFELHFEPSDAPPPARPAEASVEGMRVLMVDDNATNRRLALELLSRWGCRGEAAESSLSGFAMLEEAQARGDSFAAVVLDYQIPGMNGVEFARLVRASGTLAKTPLILLASIPERGQVERLGDLRLHAILTKPLKAQHLRDALGAIALRASPGPPASGVPAPDGRAVAGRRLRGRVLIAEDNAVNQLLAVRLAERAGCRCDVAANGLEVLEATSRLAYDLILMDCQMPEMDGFEAAREVRRRETGKPRRTAIIAMTADVMPGSRERCLDAGMDECLFKPVDAAELRGALARHLPERAPRPAVALNHTPEPASPPIDQHRIEEVAGSDLAFARRLLSDFIADARRRLADIEVALESGKPPAVARQAHALRGAAANVGAESIRAAAAAIETLGRAETLAGVPALAERLRAEIERAEPFIARMFGRTRP